MATSDSDSFVSRLITPLLAALTAFVFAGVGRSPRYESARPAVEDVRLGGSSTSNDVATLLTADPLEAPYRDYGARQAQPAAEATSDAAPTADEHESDAGGLGAWRILRRFMVAMRWAVRGSPAQDAEPYAELRAEIAEHLQRDRARLLVMAVSLRGGAWAEDHEMRARSAQAVTFALIHDQDYRAEAARNLSVLDASSILKATPHRTDRFERWVVPYAWFSRNRNESSSSSASTLPPWEELSVLVLWLDERSLGKTPMLRTTYLLREVLHGAPSERIAVRFVGPSTTGGLIEMVEDAGRSTAVRDVLRSLEGEASNGREANGIIGLAIDAGAGTDAIDEGHPLIPLQVFSPYSTVPPSEYGVDTRDDVIRVPDPDRDPDTRLRVTRTIGTDDRLAELLAAEVCERIPSLMSRPFACVGNCGNSCIAEACGCATDAAEGCRRECCADFFSGATVVSGLRRTLEALQYVHSNVRPKRIALIAEQDTDYGRFWKKQIQRAFERVSPQKQCVDIEFMPYVAVIDGTTPVTRSRQPQATTGLSPGQQYPVGPSQIDYLQRLGNQLAGAERFDAVGVFGTDVYDTLLIISALHPLLPDTLFFTIDPDLRYLHPEHVNDFRNVLIASHEPLGAPMSPGARGAAASANVSQPPQFRDQYQSAVFKTVRRLLREFASPNDAGTARPSDGASRDGHLYEVGSERFVELTTRSGAAASSALPAGGVAGTLMNWPSALGIQTWFAQPADPSARPAASPNRAQPPLALLGFGAVVVVSLLVFVARPARRRDQEGAVRVSHPAGPIALALVGWAIAMLVLIAWMKSLVWRSIPVEPLWFFDGVSAWPAIGLRLLTTCFSLAAIWHIERRLVQVHELVGRKHGLLPDRALERSSPPAVASRPPSDAARAADQGTVSFVTRHLRELVRALRATLARGLRAVLFVEAPFRQPTCSMSWLMGWGSRPTGEPPKDAAAVWYKVGNLARARWLRVLRLFVYAAVMHFALGGYFQLQPIVSPVRGEVSFLLEKASVAVSVWSYVALVFLVLETHFVANRLVVRLTDPDDTALPADALDVECRRTQLLRPHADRRLRLNLAARITHETQSLVYYPMIAVCLMILSRAPVFDVWAWPLVLVGTFCLFFLLLFLCELGTRRVAESEKRSALEYFDSEILHCTRDRSARARLEHVRKELQDLRLGAFASLFVHPIVRSAFLPLLAYGWTKQLGSGGVALFGG